LLGRATFLTCKETLFHRVGFAYGLDRQRNTVVRGSLACFISRKICLDVSQASRPTESPAPFWCVWDSLRKSNPLVNLPHQLTSSRAGRSVSIDRCFRPNSQSVRGAGETLRRNHQFFVLGNQNRAQRRIRYRRPSPVGKLQRRQRPANRQFRIDSEIVPPEQQGAWRGPPIRDRNIDERKDVHDADYSDNRWLPPSELGPTMRRYLRDSVYNGLLISLRHAPGSFISRSYTLSRTTTRDRIFNPFEQASQTRPSKLDQTHALWPPECLVGGGGLRS